MLKTNNKIKINKRHLLIALASIVLIAAISYVIFATTSCVNSVNETNEASNNLNDELNAKNSSDCEPQKEPSNNNDSLNKTEENNAKAETNDSKSNENKEAGPQQQTEADYTKLYPDLYCARPNAQSIPEKTIFLTFDDGPSERTSEILKILRENNIKATFFVTGSTSSKGKALMKQIVDEGHTIAIHTYTHEFRQIYASVNAFLDDFNKIYNLIYETTGVKPTIFRFPGGSKNSFNKNNYKELIAEMTRRGFDYFDWNLSVGDAVSRTPTPTQRCINNVLNFSKNCDHAVVLMHDAKPKTTTVEALPHIINGLKDQGFTFDKLSNNIDPAPYSLVKPYK